MPSELGSTDQLLREVLSALRDSQIIQLALAGVSQHDIREVVGVDIHRVNRIARHLRKVRREAP